MRSQLFGNRAAGLAVQKQSSDFIAPFDVLVPR